MTHHDLYKQIGIDPPRGVLLYGPPGTGKTMLAKAVAHHTTASFIRVVGSEFVQKYLGEVCLQDSLYFVMLPTFFLAPLLFFLIYLSMILCKVVEVIFVTNSLRSGVQ